MTTKWTAESVAANPKFIEMKELVQAELKRLATSNEDRSPTLKSDLAVCMQRIQGRSLSLADPSLSHALRQRLQSDLEADLADQTALESTLRRAEVDQTRTHHKVTPEEVADHLNRLAEVLAADDPARTNIELALHIDAIRGFADGRVEVKTCKLGALGGDWDDLVELASNSHIPSEPSPSVGPSVKARRLAKRRIIGEDDSDRLDDEAEFATDPDRFASLDPRWFSVDETTIPPAPECWSTANALAVGEKRRETNWTHEQLTDFFQTSVPTIRKALARAVELDPSLAKLPRKMPRARWEDSHFEEVSQLHFTGMKVRELSEQFKKSEPLIRAALAIAKGLQSKSDSDGQGSS